MDINININFNSKTVKSIFKQIILLGEKMASIKEIIEATAEEQTLIASTLKSIDALVKEVRQLLASGDIAQADEFLAEIQANSQALFEAGVKNTEVAALVDAVNGDPVA